MRLYRKNPDTGKREPAGYFSQLTFSYTFKEIDRGKPVNFAFSVPYSFSNLLQDLEQAKTNLIENLDGGDIEYRPLEKKDIREEENDQPRKGPKIDPK